MRLMPEDAHLLRQYAEQRSEAAFAELVERHASLVYSVALRKTDNPAVAEDLTQQVFADLARKALSMSYGVVLVAWLHRATCFAAGQEMRARRRRKIREQQASEMNLLDSETGSDWRAIKTELDDAVDALPGADREAVLLRFFEQRTLAQVGVALGISEDAARKRVARALERLRGLLGSRGVKTSSTALAAMLLANSVQAAPATFLAGLAAASTVAFGDNATLALITMSKLKITAVTALIVIGAGAPLLIEFQKNRALRSEVEQLRRAQEVSLKTAVQLQPDAPSDELERLRSEHAELMRLRGEIALLRAQREPTAVRNAASAEEPTSTATRSYNNVYWAADSWKNVGTETPDAAFQTLLWSASKSGDPNVTKSLIYWDGKIDPAHLADWENGVSNTVHGYWQIATNYVGVRIISQTEIDPETRSLRIEGVSNDGSSAPTDLVFRKTEKGWRQIVSMQ